MRTRISSILLVIIAVAGFSSQGTCGASPHGSDDEGTVVESAHLRESPSPFDRSRCGSAVSAGDQELSSCLSARLHIETPAPGRPLRGVLRIENSCTQPVAILTAPVETRLRLSSGVSFPAETGIDQVYAIAYVFPKAVGLEDDAFRGDGGLEVFAHPEYAVVKGQGKLSLPVTSGEALRLPPGSYGLALFTIAAWACHSSSRRTVIDFRDDVAHFTKAHGRHRQVLLSPTAIRVAPVAFFTMPPSVPGSR